MKSRYAYKVTGIVAAVVAATALSATAQETSSTMPAEPTVPSQATVPGSVAPSTTPAPTVEAPNTTATPSPTAPAGSSMTTPAAPPATPDAATADVAQMTDSTTIAAPKDFMRQAFLANEFGIAGAQLAVQKGSSQEVKDAAQAVLNDGLKTRAEMVTAIQGSTSDMHFDQAWTDDYKQKLADLQSLEGAEFDAKYLETQGELTNSTEKLYQSFAGTASDESVKTFAANTLPTLVAQGDTLESVSQGGQ